MGLKKFKTSGNPIIVQDSAAFPIESLSLYGKSSQGSTTGAQLFDINSVQLGKAWNGNLDASRAIAIIPCLPNTKYAISLDIANFDGVYVFEKASENDATSIKNTKITTTLASLNTSNSTNVMIVQFNKMNVAFSDVDVANVMLNAGSEPLPWEPYTGGQASPNPEYPQEIESVGDDGAVEIKVVSKNLAKDFQNHNYTQNGITFTKNSDGSITADGTCVGDAATYLFMNGGSGSTLKAGRYIISGCPDGGSETTYRIQMWHYDNVNSVRDFGNGAEFECGNLDSSFAWNAAIRVEVGITVNNLVFYPMIRQASNTDPTYEPYKEQSITLSTPNGLPGIPVDSDGNYTDSDGQQYIADEIRLNADGTGKWMHRIGVSDLTDAIWYKNESYKYYTRYDNTKYKWDTLVSLCTHLPIHRTLANCIFINASGHIRVNIVTEEDTVDSVKEALSGVLLYAELAEPYETDLTAEEVQAFLNLRMNKPYTTIMNDEDCFMGVEYIGTSISWTIPKTDWKSTDRFNVKDYNRIKWNLEYLHEKARTLYRNFEMYDMGEEIWEQDKKSYTVRWNVSDFNAFENNLHEINQNIFTQDYGQSQRFFENGPFIKFDELNRIESASLNMKDILDRIESGLPRLAFRLGAYKEVKV